MKMTLPAGSVRLMSIAASTIGETECETYFASSGKFFSTNMTKEGQQDVVRMPFSFHSCAS